MQQALNSTAEEKISGAIADGLRFLQDKQLVDGEFSCYRSRDPNLVQECEFDSSPFPTALICYSLSFLESASAHEIRHKAKEFLLSQIEPGDLWRYWSFKHPHHWVIPPDVDDTACASIALERMGILPRKNQPIILANRNSRGLVYTWLIPRISAFTCSEHLAATIKQLRNPLALWTFFKINESKADDVDAVVNANVLAYLGATAQTEAIIEYLVSLVQTDPAFTADKWHLSPFNLYYSISRCYYLGMERFAVIKHEILSSINSQRHSNGSIGENLLDTALAACTLINFRQHDETLERAILYLAREQQDGSWKKFPLYFGGPKRYYCWGSEELTTGFCLEALARYGSRNGTD